MAQDVVPVPPNGSIVLGSVHKIRETSGSEVVLGSLYKETHIVSAPNALSDSTNLRTIKSFVPMGSNMPPYYTLVYIMKL